MNQLCGYHCFFLCVCVCWPLKPPICKLSWGQRSPADGRSIHEKVIITDMKGKKIRRWTNTISISTLSCSGAQSPTPFDPSGSERLNRMVCVLSPDFWVGLKGRRRKKRAKGDGREEEGKTRPVSLTTFIKVPPAAWKLLTEVTFLTADP